MKYNARSKLTAAAKRRKRLRGYVGKVIGDYNRIVGADRKVVRRRSGRDVKRSGGAFARALARERSRGFYAFLRERGVDESTIRALQRRAARGGFRLAFWSDFA